MATLDDTLLDTLRELNTLRDRAKQLRQRGRQALASIPKDFTDSRYDQLAVDYDLSSEEWVGGRHPIDIALLVRTLNHRDLGEYKFESPDRLVDALTKIITTRFSEGGTNNPLPTSPDYDDAVPILTAARTMHALVRRPRTVFSTATMLCYYRIVRELYLAAFPNWIIGAARAGEGGRVSAFVTGECVRAILAFQDSISDSINFFKTTKKLWLDLERLKAIPNVDARLKIFPEGDSHWKKCLNIEFERVVLDWYAANDLRHNVIALDLSPDSIAPSDQNTTSEPIDPSPLPAVFPLTGTRQIDIAGVERVLAQLPNLLKAATDRAYKSIEAAKDLIPKFREREKNSLRDFDWRIAATESSHELGLNVIKEALEEAEKATRYMSEFQPDPNVEGLHLPELLDRLIEQYLCIYQRIHRIIEPAKRYIQDVLNRELAHAANSAKFDAGELLFAAACFGALTKWKQNEQLAEARRLLINLLPEDGRLQTTRPFQSTPQGLRLIPIAFEMTRCFAQLLQRDFAADLDPKMVRKILNAFEENPIVFPDNESIGWNFRGAPESQKPSVWVTAIAVFALDRTIRMLNERINAMVLRNFNVEWPDTSVDSFSGLAPISGGKLGLNELMYCDYELQSSFKPSRNYRKQYEEDPPRVEGISVAIRLQQMRAHLTRALLPNFYTTKSPEPIYQKAYSAVFYGPPGTGKTTLAEALATSANVPLVRLSPSDLMVQGTDVIESRARAIFESLAMLSQAVIFLDEFEPVVRTRSNTDRTRSDGAQDPPEFRFLVTGMLPKLIKLNKTAKEQSLVYCLATNYLNQVDNAAKRFGRFDLQIPIYHPDPMSRAGVFLYRLITILQKEERDGGPGWQQRLRELEKKEKFWSRTKQAIEKTAEVSAQSLATIFFSKTTKQSFLAYVLDDSRQNSPSPTPEKSSHEQKTAVEEDIEIQRAAYEKSWTQRVPRGES